MPPERRIDDFSVRQSLEREIEPAIARIEKKVDDLTEEVDLLDNKVDSLNVKFYGILGGGGLAVVLAMAKAIGWI